VTIAQGALTLGAPRVRRALPTAAVICFALALWVATGVGARDIALFVGYELGFVAIPGIVLFAAVMRRRFWAIESVAIGIPVGYSLEILAATGSSAVGVRNLLLVYPAVAVALGLAIRRYVPLEDSEASSGVNALSWGVATVILAVLACVAAEYFLLNPLPGSVPEAAYSGDTMYLLSIAAEAKHHWPITDPTVSGLPLYYHKFAMIDMAAISRVTGIELPVLLMRLYYVPLLMLVVVQIAWAAQRRAAHRLAGAVAAFFALFVGEFDLTPTISYPFLDVLSVNLVFAPSILSYIFFVPTIVLLGEILRGGATFASLGIAAVLLLGIAGAKGGTVLPVLTGATALVLIWRLVAARTFDRRYAVGLMLLGAFSAAVYVIVYHRSSQDVTFEPFKSFAEMRPLHLLAQQLPHSLGIRAIYWVPAVLVGLIGALGVAIAAVAAEVSERLPRLPADTAWLVALFGASIVPLLLLNHPGLSHVQSLPYGRMATGIFAAPALCRAGGLVVSRFSSGALFSGAARVLAGCALLIWLPVLHPFREGRLYALQYLAAAVGIAVVICVVWRNAGRGVALAAGLLAAAVIAAVNTPADVFPVVAQRAIAHQPVYPVGERDVPRDLYVALRWVRDHSDPNAVLAVNNPYIFTNDTGPYNFDYSALAERRVFLEGWAYNERALALGYHKVVDEGVQPFPRRFALNQAVFRRGSAAAIKALADDYGVRVLRVDRLAGSPAPALRRNAVQVFTNAGASVFFVKQ